MKLGVAPYGVGLLSASLILSIMIILNIRNGLSLANYSGHVQTAVIGILLIGSVLIPNIVGEVRTILNRRRQIARSYMR
jgi:rhamnose transport system permease protein